MPAQVTTRRPKLQSNSSLAKGATGAAKPKVAASPSVTTEAKRAGAVSPRAGVAGKKRASATVVSRSKAPAETALVDVKTAGGTRKKTAAGTKPAAKKALSSATRAKTAAKPETVAKPAANAGKAVQARAAKPIAKATKVKKPPATEAAPAGKKRQPRVLELPAKGEPAVVKQAAVKKRAKPGAVRARTTTPTKVEPKVQVERAGKGGKRNADLRTGALATSVAETPVVKATRKRAPKDLATQYGEKTSKRAPKKEPALARRKRMKAEERDRLRAMMAPSDEIMQRLARAGAIASSVVTVEDEAEDTTTRRKGPQAQRRPRRWESRCGKCGTTGQFKSAAGLCARCGAIAVRL